MTPDAPQVLGTYKKKACAVGASLTLLVALASGCEGPPARDKPWRRASAQVKASAVAPVLAGEESRLRAMAAAADTLTVWLDSDPVALSTPAPGPPSAWTLRITQDTVFESLVSYRPGESEARPGGYEPRLAQSWRVSPDGREIVFELQPRVSFHDGRAMTAGDVRSAIDAARRARGSDLGIDLRDVIGVEVLAARTVRVRLARSNAYVLRALAEVPVAAPAEAGEAPRIGTGPYRMRAWGTDGVELERFAGYWGRPPAVANVAFRYQPDAAEALRSARGGGEIDIIPALIPEHHPEQVRAAAAAGMVPLRLRPPALRYLAVNARRPPFDDPRVRCALARMIDRRALTAAGQGLVRAAGGAIWPGGPGDGPAMEPPPFDRAGAGALLDQAGWREAGGLRQRGNQKLLLTVLVSDRIDPERDLVLEQLRAAGFVLDTRVGATAVLDNRLRDGKFDLAFVEWRARSGEDLSSVFGTGGERNFGGFSDPKVDEILAALRLAWDPTARWHRMRELGARLAETCPVAPLVAPEPHGLVRKRVGGVSVRGGWLALRELQLAPPSADSGR